MQANEVVVGKHLQNAVYIGYRIVVPEQSRKYAAPQGSDSDCAGMNNFGNCPRVPARTGTTSAGR